MNMNMNEIKKFLNLKNKNFKKHYLPKCQIKRLSEKERNQNKDLLKKYIRKNLTLAGFTDTLWNPNSTLKVGFNFEDYCIPLNSRSEFKNQIINLAIQWCNHGSIDLEISNNPEEYDILIGFTPFIGTFSYLGTDSKIRTKNGKNSMNIDPTWLIPSIGDTSSLWGIDNYPQIDPNRKYVQHAILHEFGHAFGIIHEHQRQDRPFTWDIEWMKANINVLGLDSWESVKSNYITTFKMPDLNHGEYDPDSIMVYAWNKNATIEKIGSKINFALSNKDKEDFSLMYP